ncbi:phage protein GP46 [Acetobacteraceae bacterium AT-5844]|nr:phage protein GP46 [Acetobacteraceae bacterium AT-5844]
MTADIAIVWNSDLTGADWTLLPGGDLEQAPPLVTAVHVSLFTDARASDDDRLAPGETDRRGWWGDLLDDQPIGSRLWLLRRAKHLPETLRLAQDYIREALAWLIQDGIAASLDVTAVWQGPTRIAATITIHRATGGRETVTASWAWQGA